MLVKIKQQTQILQQLENHFVAVILQELAGMQLQTEVNQPLNFTVLQLEGVHGMTGLLFRLRGTVDLLD
ncbi:hypothetical protein D3C71_2158540 [compost metagenome]